MKDWKLGSGNRESPSRGSPSRGKGRKNPHNNQKSSPDNVPTYTYESTDNNDDDPHSLRTSSGKKKKGRNSDGKGYSWTTTYETSSYGNDDDDASSLSTFWSWFRRSPKDDSPTSSSVVLVGRDEAPSHPTVKRGIGAMRHKHIKRRISTRTPRQQ